MLFADRLEVAGSGRGEVRRTQVAANDLRGTEVEQPIARDGSGRLAARLAPTGLLDPLLVRVEVRGGEPLGLVVGSQRRAAVIRPGLRDGVDDTALKVAVLGARAEAANLEGRHPV